MSRICDEVRRWATNEGLSLQAAFRELETLTIYSITDVMLHANHFEKGHLEK